MPLFCGAQPIELTAGIEQSVVAVDLLCTRANGFGVGGIANTHNPLRPGEHLSEQNGCDACHNAPSPRAGTTSDRGAVAAMAKKPGRREIQNYRARAASIRSLLWPRCAGRQKRARRSGGDGGIDPCTATDEANEKLVAEGRPLSRRSVGESVPGEA